MQVVDGIITTTIKNGLLIAFFVLILFILFFILFFVAYELYEWGIDKIIMERLRYEYAR